MPQNNSTPATARIATYYRMSKDVQDKSIARQRAEVRPHCREKGYDVVAEEADEGISGSEVERREGLQRVLALVKAKKVDDVVVDDLKRLARIDGWDVVELLNSLRKLGIWIE